MYRGRELDVSDMGLTSVVADSEGACRTSAKIKAEVVGARQGAPVADVTPMHLEAGK